MKTPLTYEQAVNLLAEQAYSRHMSGSFTSINGDYVLVAELYQVDSDLLLNDLYEAYDKLTGIKI